MRRDLRSIASEVGISFWAVRSILIDILAMSKVSASLLSRFEDDPSDSIERVVTQDGFKQWKHPDLPPPKKFKRNRSAGKVIASFFWNSQGVIMIDYLEQGRTINCAYYAGKLKRQLQERGEGN